MTMRVFAVFALSVSLLVSGELSNRRAPGFALPDPTYSHFYDLQDYRGKLVLIDIMSTTCPHCQLLSTTLETLKQKYGAKLQILSVVLPPDNQATIQRYVTTNKVTVPILCDMGQMTISYLNAKPGQAHMEVPHLFLIDQQGMIRNDWVYGETTKAIFEGQGLAPEIDKLVK